MISNFIIIIVSVEFVNSSVRMLQSFIYIFNDTHKIYWFLTHAITISQLCHIPLLCLFMKVLWLAYLHSPYKYTIMRWAVYIVLRTILLYVVYTMLMLDPLSRDYITIVINMLFFGGLVVIYETLDLITYMLYSRRFYLHLKSRELEAKLFMDREKYIENKYLRIHFKVATILVAIH